jgi:hypothetical protein
LASAQRKIASHSSALVNVERLLYIPAQDCGNKRFETWITTQGIKVRIDVEEVAIEIVVIASRCFQPIQRLILFAKRRVAARLNSRALVADSRQTDLCAYLSASCLSALFSTPSLDGGGRIQ